ncbi:MAG: biotin--[acetyl-CoA-carboxylase] ligase [Bacteroides sp.]|nr:biotin--[acetyl-CoA-carboxylase] ligase [Bacteroides sp.]
MIKLIEIDETASTNTLMSQQIDTLSHGTVILARRQSAGRGQRGNSWEAEPDKNVTMSLLLRELPVDAPRQFAVSEAVALAVADTVCRLVPERAPEVCVKWPNDIYVADRKIAGILIECGIMGRGLTHAIAGIGLNVNQTVFVSDAPNPESVARLTGRCNYDVASIATEIAQRITNTLSAPDFDAEALHARFLSRMWRRSGNHLWRSRDTGLTFRASIAGVSPEGFLTLLPEGSGKPLPPFAFKEVEAVPDNQNG